MMISSQAWNSRVRGGVAGAPPPFLLLREGFKNKIWIYVRILLYKKFYILYVLLDRHISLQLHMVLNTYVYFLYVFL